jgi:uncharacterized protein
MMQRLVWLAAMVLVPLAGQGASFDCTKATSDDEKTICGDAALSTLDEQLARAYKQALQKGPRTKVQADQKAWLKERGGCGADSYCLTNLYNRRIAQLQGVHWSLADWQRASGTWSEAESTETSNQRLVIKSVTAKDFEFDLNSIDGTHTGEISGVARFTPDDRALYKSEEDGVDCRLAFVPLDSERLQVEQLPAESNSDKSSCGNYYGGGVDFGGLFLKGIHQKELSLMDLGVFKSPAQDQAFRTLVGDAYHAFVERNPRPDEDTKDIDGLGAEVATGWLRGDAPHGAIIMHTTDGRFYAAYKDWDEHKGDQLHYFSNDPRYANKLPATIASWSRGSEN